MTYGRRPRSSVRPRCWGAGARAARVSGPEQEGEVGGEPVGCSKSRSGRSNTQGLCKARASVEGEKADHLAKWSCWNMRKVVEICLRYGQLNLNCCPFQEHKENCVQCLSQQHSRTRLPRFGRGHTVHPCHRAPPQKDRCKSSTATPPPQSEHLARCCFSVFAKAAGNQITPLQSKNFEGKMWRKRWKSRSHPPATWGIEKKKKKKNKTFPTTPSPLRKRHFYSGSFQEM